MNRNSVAMTVLLATACASVGAQAQNKLTAGTLTCSGGQGVGLVLGSQKTYSCSFQPADGSRAEPYRATVTRIGLDIGVTGESTMVWTVLAASQAMAPRALAGNYGGVVADASVGLGAGAKVLVGGSKNTVTLQPVSVQGQTGLNLAVGVGELILK